MYRTRNRDKNRIVNWCIVTALINTNDSSVQSTPTFRAVFGKNSIFSVMASRTRKRHGLYLES